MKYQNIRVGHFISRPNRYIAKIEIEGAEETVHEKNTGRCAELLVPGVEVYVQDSQQEAEGWLSDNELLQGEMQTAVSSKSTNIWKKRKTRWDLIAVRKGNRLFNMDSQIPNKIVKEWMEQKKWIQIRSREISKMMRSAKWGRWNLEKRETRMGFSF